MHERISPGREALVAIALVSSDDEICPLSLGHCHAALIPACGVCVCVCEGGGGGGGGGGGAWVGVQRGRWTRKGDCTEMIHDQSLQQYYAVTEPSITATHTMFAGVSMQEQSHT